MPKFSYSIMKEWMLKLEQYQTFYIDKFQNFLQPWRKSKRHFDVNLGSFTRKISKIFFNYEERVDKIKQFETSRKDKLPKIFSTMVKEWMVKLGQRRRFIYRKIPKFSSTMAKEQKTLWCQFGEFHKDNFQNVL